MNVYDHQDSRGVFVELWTIDLLDGDLSAALLLSQLLWWHQPAKDGSVKLQYQRDGHDWLVRADDAWPEECRLTMKQVRRIRSVLVSKGFIEHRRFKVNGAPTSAWRPRLDAIREAIRPNPELPSEGQFQGSDPQGVVPIPSSPISKTSKVKVIRPEGDLRTDAELVEAAFNAFWTAYPLKKAKGKAKTAWPKAVQAAGGDLRKIVIASRRFAADPNLPELQFVPYPATWLNGEQWDDPPYPPRSGNGASSELQTEPEWQMA